MRKGLFWLSDRQWERIEGFLSIRHKGAHRVDDRRVISGIIHVLKAGMPWSSAPMEYGPYKTLYNRFYRWSKRGVWAELFRMLVRAGEPLHTALIDSTIVKAHQVVSTVKGGSMLRRLAAHMVDEQQKSTPSRMSAAGLMSCC